MVKLLAMYFDKSGLFVLDPSYLSHLEIVEHVQLDHYKWGKNPLIKIEFFSFFFFVKPGTVIFIPSGLSINLYENETFNKHILVYTLPAFKVPMEMLK